MAEEAEKGEMRQLDKKKNKLDLIKKVTKKDGEKKRDKSPVKTKQKSDFWKGRIAN
jgi:hypothetical protein